MGWWKRVGWRLIGMRAGRRASEGSSMLLWLDGAHVPGYTEELIYPKILTGVDGAADCISWNVCNGTHLHEQWHAICICLSFPPRLRPSLSFASIVSRIPVAKVPTLRSYRSPPRGASTCRLGRLSLSTMATHFQSPLFHRQVASRARICQFSTQLAPSKWALRCECLGYGPVWQSFLERTLTEL